MSVNLEKEHFVEPYEYAIFYDPDDSLYKAKNGVTSDIDYDDSNISTLLNAVVAAIGTSGGLIKFQNRHFQFPSVITLPYGSKNLTFQGTSGYGKSSQTQGTTFTQTFAGTLFTINATNDIRSAYALNWRDIKFIGHNAAGDICLDLPNLDTGSVTYCTFLQFAQSIVNDYQGSSYPVAEQPGKLYIAFNEFAEACGLDHSIFLDKSTQNIIADNVFESYGDFEGHVSIKDTNKTKIVGNEFNQSSTPANMTEIIRLEATNGTFLCEQNLIEGNWVYRAVNSYPFIRCVHTGGNLVRTTFSKGNIIQHGFDNMTADSTYAYVDTDERAIRADDFMTYPSNLDSAFRDMNATWAAGTARKNYWSPCTCYLKCNLPVGGSVTVQQSYSVASLFDVLMESNNNDTSADSRVITFFVPSNSYFKVNLAGGATQTGLITVFR